MPSTDRIEKEVLLHAPRPRVWAAIGDSEQFGAWFRCRFEGPFEAGKELHGTITEPDWDGTPFVVFVERVEPERHLSFRWHAEDVDLEGDYADAATTLVSFDLEDAPGGTLLRIVESGFDALDPGVGPEKRDRNDEGWSIQAERIAQYVGDAE